MKIGLLASNARPIPGGEKNIFAPGVLILALANGLAKKGHDVTLFAPKDTITKAKLISGGLFSAYDDLNKYFTEDKATFLQLERDYDLILTSKVFEMAKDNKFDILHSHRVVPEVYFTNFVKCPVVFTNHSPYGSTVGGITTEADKLRNKKYKNSCYYTALSDFIRKSIDLNFIATVYNGIDVDRFSYSPSPKKDLLFVNRLIESKGPDTAIEIAKRINKNLQIVGDKRGGKKNIDFYNKISKDFKNKNIDFVNFVPFSKIHKYYQNSKVVVNPIRGEESFGLVMAEAMSCGTPVVSYAKGAVPEVIKDGKTGYIINSSKNDIRGSWIIKKTGIEGIMEAINRIYSLSPENYKKMRQDCHNHVLNNFTLKKMVDGYEKAYVKTISLWKKKYKK